MESSKKEKTNKVVTQALKFLSGVNSQSHLRKESSLTISRDDSGNWSKTQTKVLKTGRFPSSDPAVLKGFKEGIGALVSENPESKEILAYLSNPSTAVGEGDSFVAIEALNEVFGDATDAQVKHTQGQVIFIDVWATWCGPCQDPMQHNKEIKEKFGAKWGDQVRIICVSLDDTKDDALKRINEKKWNKLEHYHVEGGWNDEHNLLQNYQVRGIPYGILVNQEGKVVWIGHPGLVKMEEKIESLLSGKGDAGIPQDSYKKLKSLLAGEFLKSNESKKQGRFSFNISLKKIVSFDAEGKRTSVTYEKPILEVKGKIKDESLIKETMGEITKIFSSDIVQVKENILDSKAEKLGALTLIRDALKANDLPLVEIEWKKASYLGYWGEIELESSNEINPKTNLKPSPEIIEKVTNFTKSFPDYLAKATQVQKDWLRRFRLKSKVEVGDVFVGFDVEDAHSDQTLKLDHKQGEVLLVDFWATWCGPCQGPMGHNQAMLTKNKEKWGEKVYTFLKE
jgi:thiol-disulfide isomerase/thioredoxin